MCMKISEIQPGIEKKEKSVAISNVKNKLKKRTSIINKRGPMKAVHPVDNMQKEGIFNLLIRIFRKKFNLSN